MRVVQAQGYQDPRDAISHDWIRLFQDMGWSPRLIPNRLDDITPMLDDMDGLILTGGNDLNPDRSGLSADYIRDAALERDQQETRLLKQAETRRLPTLGVCRGLQMINCHYGGRLVRVDSSAHVATRHQLRIHGEPWRSLLEAQGDVNSFHNCGVAADGLGRDLVAFATSSEGAVEGLHHRRLPMVGIMWHPERCAPPTPADRELLCRLFAEGSFWEHTD